MSCSLLFFTLTMFCLSCFMYLSHALNNGFSVELIHRDSSNSPIYNPEQTKFQRVYNVVGRSKIRNSYFTQQFSLNTNKPILTLTPDSGEYLMSYSIGSPPFKVYGFMDTGSNLVWLQCQPCNTCYNQTSPIFNSSKSSSYKHIHCSSKTCKSEGEINTSCSYDDVCEYSIGYDGVVKSKGDLSVETLTLDSTSDSSVSFSRIVIGCGHNNFLPYSGRNGQSSGIVGFGRGSFSLTTQLGSIGNKFSYCLIPFHSNSSNKLNFGDAADVLGESVVSTPIANLKGIGKLYYFLTLKAFSVGNKRIEFGGFKLKGTNASTQNIIIDSGTPLTMLPRHFYSKLESTVTKVVKLQRVKDPNHELSLCYNTTWEQSNSFPIITTHFSGADVILNYNSTFVSLHEGSTIMCFAFIPSQDDLAIFGTFAQHNLLVGYDLKKRIISFKPTDCTKQ